MTLIKYRFKRLLFMLCGVLWCVPLHAQPHSVASGEYFVDTDPGFGLGTPITITADTVATAGVTIPTSGLRRGMHTLYVRFKDTEGNWGLTESKAFYVGAAQTVSPVTNVEYFVDTDPGVGSGLPVTPVDSVGVQAISTTGLSTGFHTLYMRAKNEGEGWGQTESHSFYVGASEKPAPVVAVEYFYGTDPGVGRGVAVSVGPADAVDTTLAFSTTDLAVGEHTVGVRAKNADGLWGFSEQASFETTQKTTPNPPVYTGEGIVWDPVNSTYDGKPFVLLQPGVGGIVRSTPSATNPAGEGKLANGVYTFGFATAIPGANGPTMAQTELGSSPLKAGTNLVLRFNKAETDHISFVSMVADASDLSAIGFKELSPTQIEIRAKIVKPVVSESNNPAAIEAAFGLIMQATASRDNAFNFRGTVFVTDMHWFDVDAPGLSDLPQAQTAEDVSGMVAGIAASSISGNLANFTAFMPEDFFAFARSNGVEVTGANCLGYRTYVELKGSDEGFFKLNEPTDQPFDDAGFDIDGNGQADPMWRFRIANSTWSRQTLTFGKIIDASSGGVQPTPDFDGDGKVAFSDFLIFAGVFGKGQSDPDFKAVCDLNEDGSIAFSDFLLFAQAFGKPLGG